ncbi:hypothetical protein BMI87_19840 [Thioclava sp. F28-4]|nr:hypothetical protein BMI87_19840 [Thioclava sp. F28-4]
MKGGGRDFSAEHTLSFQIAQSAAAAREQDPGVWKAMRLSQGNNVKKNFRKRFGFRAAWCEKFLF